MPVSLSPLPYARAALEPWVSARTLSYHYDRHYAGYVSKLNGLLAKGSLSNASLAKIVRKAWKTRNLSVFNTAAQVWNHEFYFRSLQPASAQPTGLIGELISRDFGDLENLSVELANASARCFGSGWVWLVLEAEALKVVTTANADSPLLYDSQIPLLAIDVWEHAYYLDYQHDRRQYTSEVATHLLNWNRVNEHLAFYYAKLKWSTTLGHEIKAADWQGETSNGMAEMQATRLF